MARLLVTAGVALAGGGCAHLTTYNKPVDLRSGSLAIDVKQRVVFSQQTIGREGATSTVVCAEPSPDALTVLGASGALSISALEKGGNVGASLAETGAFVGLRTQSIQLLRDAMYRLCEGYAGGAISPPDYAAMQRRYQSTMMGLIAIEQLTRPVVAGQALLTNAASAQAGASAGDAAVDKAEAGVKSASDSSLAAKSETDKATARLEKAKGDVASLSKQLAMEKAKPKPDEAAIKSLVDQQPAADKEVRDAELALVDARRREAAADENLGRARAQLRDAQTRVVTSASGGGALAAVAQSTAASADSLTTGVTAIVEEINRSYTKDTCITLMVELARPQPAAAVAPAVAVAPALPSPMAQVRPSLAPENQVAVNNAFKQTLETCTAILAEAASDAKRKSDQAEEERKRRVDKKPS
ncbi:hypothetical protein [Piscinibacter sp. HJYY11]|uniref:hypothetical protein n=1 Tax=Piscinibacter sp. HJYY11 TaxID=2801333 RepID=UPI00191D8837|nr:hypothetical protein [Piscinibacter sp. HJYY11]MBL0727162.1 hypothetical protein [Piscinibacter sp. HJYY11]